MNIVFIGRPYSGKGTQAALLGEKYALPVFSMGEIIRHAYRAGNKKAVEGFKQYTMKGLHVPISLKFDLLKEKLERTKNGFILDNFPATKEDLEALMAYLEGRNLSIDKVFHLVISKEAIARRMRVSRGRMDDDPKIVIKRLSAQDIDRAYVLNYFRRKGVLEEVDSEKAIEDVHREILTKLEATDDTN